MNRVNNLRRAAVVAPWTQHRSRPAVLQTLQRRGVSEGHIQAEAAASDMVEADRRKHLKEKQEASNAPPPPRGERYEEAPGQPTRVGSMPTSWREQQPVRPQDPTIPDFKKTPNNIEVIDEVQNASG